MLNIRAKIMEQNKTMTEVAELLSKKYGKPVSVQNLSQKIRRGSIRFFEVEDIAEVLGCELVWKKKEPQQ